MMMKAKLPEQGWSLRYRLLRDKTVPVVSRRSQQSASQQSAVGSQQSFFNIQPPAPGELSIRHCRLSIVDVMSDFPFNSTFRHFVQSLHRYIYPSSPSPVWGKGPGDGGGEWELSIRHCRLSIVDVMSDFPFNSTFRHFVQSLHRYIYPSSPSPVWGKGPGDGGGKWELSIRHCRLSIVDVMSDFPFNSTFRHFVQSLHRYIYPSSPSPVWVKGPGDGGGKWELSIRHCRLSIVDVMSDFPFNSTFRHFVQSLHRYIYPSSPSPVWGKGPGDGGGKWELSIRHCRLSICLSESLQLCQLLLPVGHTGL